MRRNRRELLHLHNKAEMRRKVYPQDPEKF